MYGTGTLRAVNDPLAVIIIRNRIIL